MRRFIAFLFVLFAAICVQRPALADVRLAGVFGDHMVLQQGAKIPVWGWGTPGEAVQVALGERSASTTINADGRWRVDLDPLLNNDTPLTLDVVGHNTLKISDVLIGEVWLASGQSNMQYSLKQASDAATAIPAADIPQIRLCIVGSRPELHPLEDRSVKWEICSPDTAKKFSAVAYFFGRDLHAALHCPIGLIDASVAGTPAQSWVSEPSLHTSPVLAHYLADYGQAQADAATQPTTRLPQTRGEKSKSPALSAGVPTSLYNGMIAPLEPLAIKGVIWYQGESNTDHASEYQTLFPALITGWRQAWGEGDFPFLFVQLPGFGRRDADPTPETWAVMRQAQMAALALPNTAMAVTIDLVPARAILHPKNKSGVGARLALLARQQVYQQDIESSGPTFAHAVVDGQKIRVQFDHAQGLAASSRPEEGPPPTTLPSNLSIEGFAVAGSDGQFVPAQAMVEHATAHADSVVVWNPSVAEPVFVRYAWADNPTGNLYNAANLPAAPFTTAPIPALAR